MYSFAEKQFDTKDPVVLYSIGKMFDSVHKNYKKATKYFNSSCDMGSYKGCESLLNWNYNKYGSKEYIKYAKKLDELGGKLCNEGDKEACRTVAYSHYSQGDGASATENALAEQYFKKGCELGDPASCSELWWSFYHVKKLNWKPCNLIYFIGFSILFELASKSTPINQLTCLYNAKTKIIKFQIQVKALYTNGLNDP